MPGSYSTTVYLQSNKTLAFRALLAVKTIKTMEDNSIHSLVNWILDA